MPSDYWVCDCCEPEVEPYPYSGPYSGGQGPAGPCDCCGGETVVLTIDDARGDYGDPTVAVQNCPRCPGGSRPRYDQIVGESISLTLCAENCTEEGTSKVYLGCGEFDVTYHSNQHDDGVPCDREGVLYLFVRVLCARIHATQKRWIFLEIGEGYWTNEADAICLFGPDCEGWFSIDGVAHGVCPDRDDLVGEHAENCEGDDPEQVSTGVNQGVPVDGARCVAGCSDSISFTGTSEDVPGTPDIGIFGVTVHF